MLPARRPGVRPLLLFAMMDSRLKRCISPLTHKRYAVSQGVWGNWFPHKKKTKKRGVAGRRLRPAQGVDAYRLCR